MTSSPGISTQRAVLIVNADDFGLCGSVNEGIIHAHEHGIVTSASMMVRQPAAVGAALYARSHPRLGVGLHLDLGEWEYRDGEWRELYRVVDPRDAAAVEGELHRQLETFRALLGANPTHLDSHQHAHRDEPARSVAMAMARELDVPLRHCSPHITYVGGFYGQTNKGAPYHQAIMPAALVAGIQRLTPGVFEFGCHPGASGDLPSVYAAERPMEVAALCDARVREAAAGVELRSFAGLGFLPRAAVHAGGAA